MPVECARVAHHGEPAGLAERLDPWYRDVSYTTPSTPPPACPGNTTKCVGCRPSDTVDDVLSRGAN